MSKYVSLHGFGGSGDSGDSGGSELNFEVVGGTTQPANPIENTFWVNTNTDISKYVFSITEPSNPIEGMVWFSCEDTSTNEFNALKDNILQIYPQAVKQYVSGAWVAVSVMMYQNATWVKHPKEHWLVKDGVIDSVNLVGFTAGTQDGNGTGESSSMGSGGTAPDAYIYTQAKAVSNSAVYRAWTSKVNIKTKEYNTLCLDMKATLNYSSNAVAVGSVAYNPSSSFDRQIVRLDISGLTQDYPLKLIARAWVKGDNVATIYYYNIWLE